MFTNIHLEGERKEAGGTNGKKKGTRSSGRGDTPDKRDTPDERDLQGNGEGGDKGEGKGGSGGVGSGGGVGGFLDSSEGFNSVARVGQERLAEYLSNPKEQDDESSSHDILVTARRAAKVVSCDFVFQ